MYSFSPASFTDFLEEHSYSEAYLVKKLNYFEMIPAKENLITENW